MKKLRGMSRGFTLIELLIVLAVIAALLAIVTPIALNALTQAKATQVAANLRNIKAAFESYVYTEQATVVKKDDLVNSKYLSKWPGDEYDMEDAELVGSVVVATITYYANDDTFANKVVSILPEATKTGDDVKLVVKAIKWW